MNPGLISIHSCLLSIWHSGTLLEKAPLGGCAPNQNGGGLKSGNSGDQATQSRPAPWSGRSGQPFGAQMEMISRFMNLKMLADTLCITLPCFPT